MKYPDEKRMLVIRPCVKTICLNIKPAARLLAHLLYLARNCSEDEATFTVSCTQQEIIDGLIDEIDIKTLHRTAIPVLRLLGFLDVDGASYRYTYIVHLDLIQHCLLHINNKEQLDKILIVSMQWQLDKYRIEIDKCPIELVKCPIDMDKCLIPFRQMSNSKRGRKPRTQAGAVALSENPDNKRDNRDRLDKEREGVFVATQTSRSYLEEFDTAFEDEETVERPAINLNGATTHDTPLTADLQSRDARGVDHLHRSEHLGGNGDVAIAPTPGEPDTPPSVLSRQSYTTPKSRVAQGTPTVLEGHEHLDGAATDVDGGPRASDDRHSARAEQASQATSQQQAASRQAQNGGSARQEKPLSLQEDEPTVRPETPAQRKRRIEAREKEIWALVEAGLRTKFTRTHRQLKANTAGMERLIEDETDNQTINEGLEKLSDFWKNQFDLAMFHAKLPGLVREQTSQPKGKLADKSPQNVRDVQYEAALRKIGQSLDEEVPAWLDFDNYVGNGPEERQRLIERGLELKAQGFCPDL